MHSTKRIVIDLLSGNRPETIHVVQGDAYSRMVEIDLRQGKKPWAIPDGISVAVEYIKPDGTKGLYDTLPDGTQAWNTEGNILTLMLAPQMLTANGSVATQVSITKDNARLSLFKFWVYVNQKIRGAESEDYINWRSAFLPQVEGAKAGQYFEIEEVDKNGRIVKIKPVDAPQGAGGGITVESDPTVPEWAKQPNPPSVVIPTKLPNPHALTFTGAVNATYDGSAAVSVEIPQGGGGGSGGWELIGEAISDGTSAGYGIYVPVNFEEYAELFVCAYTAESVFCRVVVGDSLAWYNGAIVNSNSKNLAAGAVAGSGDAAGSALLLQTHIKNIVGQLFPFSGWNDGYSNSLGTSYRYMVPIACPRNNLLAKACKYVRMDTSNSTVNPSVPEGNWIKVYGRK